MSRTFGVGGIDHRREFNRAFEACVVPAEYGVVKQPTLVYISAISDIKHLSSPAEMYAKRLAYHGVASIDSGLQVDAHILGPINITEGPWVHIDEHEKPHFKVHWKYPSFHFGYVNTQWGALHIQRYPVRQWKRGLALSCLQVSAHTAGVPAYITFSSTGLLTPVLDLYYSRGYLPLRAAADRLLSQARDRTLVVRWAVSRLVAVGAGSTPNNVTVWMGDVYAGEICVSNLKFTPCNDKIPSEICNTIEKGLYLQ